MLESSLQLQPFTQLSPVLLRGCPTTWPVHTSAVQAWLCRLVSETLAVYVPFFVLVKRFLLCVRLCVFEANSRPRRLWRPIFIESAILPDISSAMG